MADPKYAGLPGIVQDQPDVYETSDLPEAEQNEYSDLTESTDALEVLHISAKDAHSKFADKVLDASRVDFSDRISRKNRTGYNARRIEWDVAGADEKDENVVQRYNRLMCEVAALQQDILQQKEQGEEVPYELSAGDDKVQKQSVSGAELHQLSQQLMAQLVPLQSHFGGVQDLDPSQQGVGTTALSGLIEAVKQSKKSDGKPSLGGTSKAPGSHPSSLTYQMMYSPEISKLSNIAPAVELEKRIERIEKLLGNDQEKLSRLWSWTREGSVLGAVTALGQRMALMEPSQLDHIEGRLHGVHVKMNAIAEKSQSNVEKENKVQELYELVQKCYALSSALPETVDRMEALQEIHNEAAQFGHSLQQLDVAQTKLSANLESNDTLLKNVNEKFVENISAINSSIASLEARMKALDKK